MALLLYCMTEAAVPIQLPPSGVGEVSIESVVETGIRCFYSSVDSLAGDTEKLRADALRFHAVIRKAFEDASGLPFRFPTLLETEQQLRQYLRAHASEHLEDLRRLQGLVQMEVRIRTGTTPGQADSGADYLQRRLRDDRTISDHSARAFAAGKSLIKEWKLRKESNGARCYALVRREDAPVFVQCVQLLLPDEGVTMLVSGPWPPTEFLVHAPAP